MAHPRIIPPLIVSPGDRAYLDHPGPIPDGPGPGLGHQPGRQPPKDSGGCPSAGVRRCWRIASPTPLSAGHLRVGQDHSHVLSQPSFVPPLGPVRPTPGL